MYNFQRDSFQKKYNFGQDFAANHFLRKKHGMVSIPFSSGHTAELNAQTVWA